MADPSVPMSFRLPLDLALSLNAEAKRRETTVSEVIRQAVLSIVGKPIGYQCAHMDIMSAPGVLLSPSFPCACTPEPFYWPTQRRRPLMAISAEPAGESTPDVTG